MILNQPDHGEIDIKGVIVYAWQVGIFTAYVSVTSLSEGICAKSIALRYIYSQMIWKRYIMIHAGTPDLRAESWYASILLDIWPNQDPDGWEREAYFYGTVLLSIYQVANMGE